MKPMNLLLGRRKLELGVGGFIALAMAALLYGVTALTRPPSDDQLAATVSLEPITVLPDFKSARDVKVKKSQFFAYLEDYIIAENRAIAQLRAELMPLLEIASSGTPLSEPERKFFNETAELYKIDIQTLTEAEVARELMLRVDEIPVSLALAQAANESAWGTSRFTLQGNNIFGEWCFSPGCGLVPLRRPQGASYEVESFDSIAESIESYMHNINTHNSYRHLRVLRAEMRNNDGTMNPILLATGLAAYSQRGEHYVDEVQTIIKQNNLMARDSLQWVLKP